MQVLLKNVIYKNAKKLSLVILHKVKQYKGSVTWLHRHLWTKVMLLHTMLLQKMQKQNTANV